MTDEEVEAFLRKYTLNGQMREVHDTSAILAHSIIHELCGFLLKILDILGI